MTQTYTDALVNDLMARDAEGQSSAVRADQIEVLTENFMTAGYPPIPARKLAEDTVAEAETRGAAEQRRKDAEECCPVYQVWDDQGARWENCPEGNEDWRWTHAAQADKRVYYTHPANIAALEARIAELEGEVTALKKPAYYAIEGDDFCQSSVADIFDSCDAEHNTIIQVNGFRQVSSQWAFFDGENLHTFPTEAEAEAARAALTREGGV